MYTEHRKDRLQAAQADDVIKGTKHQDDKKREALRRVRVDAVATTPSYLEDDKVCVTFSTLRCNKIRTENVNGLKKNL